MLIKHTKETEAEFAWRLAHENAQVATGALDLAIVLRLKPQVIATLRKDWIESIRALNEAFAACYPDIQKYYE